MSYQRVFFKVVILRVWRDRGAILRHRMYNGFVHYVYILQSLKDKSLYFGYSSDLRKRLKKHNAGQVSSTKDKTPLKLIYYEAYLDRKDATGREKFLKSGAGWRFIKKQLTHYLNVHS